MGYHKVPIKKGIYGEFSKIQEEMDELMDAHSQNSPVLELVELSDLLGAIEGYVAKYNLTVKDLWKLSEATMEEFKEGTRK